MLKIDRDMMKNAACHVILNVDRVMRNDESATSHAIQDTERDLRHYETCNTSCRSRYRRRHETV